MMKQYRKILIVAVMLIAILLLEGIGHGLTNQLSTQSLNETWSQEEKFAQISCFFECACHQPALFVVHDVAADCFSEDFRVGIGVEPVICNLECKSEVVTEFV